MSKSAATILFFAATAAAQTASTPIGPTPTPSQVETTVSLGVAAQLTASRVQITEFFQSTNVNTQALDPSAGVLGTIRQSFKPWLGYTASFGYTRTTEVNTEPNIASNSRYLAIPNNVYETSLAWHLQKHIGRRLTGFVDAGAGALTFLPVHHAYPNNFAPSVTFRPLGVGSVGVDYHFNQHLALRAEYRGLFYKYPDFGGTVGRSLTLSSQPTVSLVYQFGRKK